MSVRKIRPNARSLTGVLPSLRRGVRLYFESKLERDALYIARMRQDVEDISTQPLQIPWTDAAGKRRTYTPDIRIDYKPSIHRPFDEGELPFRRAKTTEIIEIKYYDELVEDIFELLPKLVAARAYCQARSWRFTVLTDRTIYSLDPDQARFLFDFMRYPIDRVMEDKIKDSLIDMKAEFVCKVIDSLAKSPEEREDYLAEIWKLAARRAIFIENRGIPDHNSIVRWNLNRSQLW